MIDIISLTQEPQPHDRPVQNREEPITTASRVEAENCDVVVNNRDYESIVVEVLDHGREVYALEIIGARNVRVIQ